MVNQQYNGVQERISTLRGTVVSVNAAKEKP